MLSDDVDVGAGGMSASSFRVSPFKASSNSSSCDFLFVEFIFAKYYETRYAIEEMGQSQMILAYIGITEHDIVKSKSR